MRNGFVVAVGEAQTRERLCLLFTIREGPDGEKKNLMSIFIVMVTEPTSKCTHN